MSLILVLQVLTIIVFLASVIFALNLYKGNFGISAPYFVMSCFLLLGGALLSQVDSLVSSISNSPGFVESLEILQILAGAFIIIGLYKIFEARFATESFSGFGGKK
jgi:hypothetical protein